MNRIQEDENLAVKNLEIQNTNTNYYTILQLIKNELKKLN